MFSIMHFVFRVIFTVCLVTYWISFSTSLDVPAGSSDEKHTETTNIPISDERNHVDISLPEKERSTVKEKPSESQSSEVPIKDDNHEYIPPLGSDFDLDSDIHKPSSSSQDESMKDGAPDSESTLTIDNTSDTSSSSSDNERERTNDSVLVKPVSLEEVTETENEEIPTFKEFQRKVEEENAKQRLIRQQHLNIAKHHDSAIKLPTLPVKGSSSSKGAASPNSGISSSPKTDEEDSSRKSGNINNGAPTSEKVLNRGLHGESEPQGEHSSISTPKEASTHTNSLSHGETESGGSESVGKLPSIIELSNGHKRVVTPDDSVRSNQETSSASGSPTTKNVEIKTTQGGNEVRERSSTHNGDRKEESVESPSGSNIPSLDNNQQDTNKGDINQAKRNVESGESLPKIQRNVQESTKAENGASSLDTKEIPSSSHNDVENKVQLTDKGHPPSPQHSTTSSTTTQSTPPTNTKSPTQPPHPKTNVASRSCGAKLLEVSDSMENSQALLNNNPDEYMNQPCAGEKWFVLETCEAVQIRTIQIANFEFFSSRLKTFHVYTSDRYPVKQWELLGVFQALDEKGAQLFEVRDDKFVKYLKFEFLDHYGNEHYCPMSMVGVYGTLSDFIEDDHISGTNVEEHEDSATSASVSSDEEDPLSKLASSSENPLKSDKIVDGDKVFDQEKDGSKSVEANGSGGPNSQTTSKDNYEDLSSTTKQPSVTQTSPNIDEGGSLSNNSSGTDVAENDINGVNSEMNHTQVNSLDQESKESTQASENSKSTSKETDNANDIDKATPVTPIKVEEDHVEGLLKKATDLIRNVAANFQKQPSTEESQPSKEAKDQKTPTAVSPSNETSTTQESNVQSINCTSKINMSDILPLWDRLSSCGSLLASYHLDHSSKWMKKEKNTDFPPSQMLLSLTPLRAYPLCQYVRVMIGWSIEEFICIVNYVQQLQSHNHTNGSNEMSYVEYSDHSQPLDSLSLEEENETESEEHIASVHHTPSPKVVPSATVRTIPPSSTSTSSNSQKLSKSSTNGGSSSQMPPLKKDIIYMRLNNRMVALEQKVNVSMNYLEELSQSHRRQMERQARSFNHTLVKLTETAESAEARDRKQQIRISQLERHLRELRNRLRPNALYHHHQHRHYHRHTFPRPSEPPENLRASPVTTISDSAKAKYLSPEDLWSFITKDFVEVIGISEWVLTVFFHLLLAIILQLLIFYCVVLPRLRRYIIQFASSSSSTMSTANGHMSSSKVHRESYHDNKRMDYVKEHMDESYECHKLAGEDSHLIFNNNTWRCMTAQMKHSATDCQCTQLRFNTFRQREDSAWPLSRDQCNDFITSIYSDPVRVTARTRSESALMKLS